MNENSLRKFHLGLKPALMHKYLEYANYAATGHLDPLAQGEQTVQVELFSFMKQLVHKIGLTCWVSPHALQPEYFEPLVKAYEQLDPEDGFQDLRSLVGSILSGHSNEKRALDTMERVLRDIWLNQAGACLFLKATLLCVCVCVCVSICLPACLPACLPDCVPQTRAFSCNLGHLLVALVGLASLAAVTMHTLLAMWLVWCHRR